MLTTWLHRSNRYSCVVRDFFPQSPQGLFSLFELVLKTFRAFSAGGRPFSLKIRIKIGKIFQTLKNFESLKFTGQLIVQEGIQSLLPNLVSVQTIFQKILHSSEPIFGRTGVPL